MNFLEKPYCLWNGDVEEFLDALPEEEQFDLAVTSPPYNIGKSYEQKTDLCSYLEWQRRIIRKITKRLKSTGSICWQVGNHVAGTGRDAVVTPLDIPLHAIFLENGLTLRNRIIWKYGHGMHWKHCFSRRYEVILWYTKSNNYKFNLDDVRVPSKYPNKKHFKGDKKGELSGNPLGKNPEDVWEIPNVKSAHVEKTIHPCQFPVELAERLVLSLTDENDVVFDPFGGVLSSGVAALLHGRCFVGCETVPEYLSVGEQRLQETIAGTIKTRPLGKEIRTY